VPVWVRDAVVYQIFPDRFRRAGPVTATRSLEPWGARPTADGFQGGNLRGILEKLDYLADLGVDALYLNPIFEAPSNHRYDTTDYGRIDPLLGTIEDFRALVREAHRRGLRLLLDGVFNHCGRGFFAFADLLRNQERSRYRSWFRVTRFPVDAFSPGPATDYHAWWNLKSLPKLDVRNREVRAHLLRVARRWIEEGADGWRLDVPDEVDDPSFWEEFRATVREANPDAYLLGEIWSPDPSWVGPRRFDGLIGYPWRDAVLDLLGTDSPDVGGFANRVEELAALYPREHAHAMLLPLGSHDTPRLRTALRGDLRRMELALRFQLAWPGVPSVYYGDEIGLAGGPDPDCRGAFAWEPDPAGHGLHRLLKRLIAVRRASPALRRGTLRRVHLDRDRGVYAFLRTRGAESVLVVLNASGAARTIRLPLGRSAWPDGRPMHDLLGSGSYPVRDRAVELPLRALDCAWLGEEHRKAASPAKTARTNATDVVEVEDTTRAS
jgi:cyclomaltodextrinase